MGKGRNNDVPNKYNNNYSERPEKVKIKNGCYYRGNYSLWKLDVAKRWED